MHPDRLSFLAGKHAQPRKVVMNERSAAGTVLTLECGHVSNIVSHFDCSKVIERNCRYCGEEFVKTSSMYAEEFK